MIGMKRVLKYMAVMSGACLMACGDGSSDTEWIDESAEQAADQLLYMADEISDAPDTLCFPRTVREGKVYLERPEDWTSGFYPGSLWLAYELTGNERLAAEARKYTNRLQRIQYYTGNHDVGFMMYCSYGQGLRLKPEPTDKQILVNTAESLCQRYSDKVGLIRSWDFGEWSYPVIIDNMMNLELLFWASQATGNDKYRKIAVSHADKTLKNHFREDMTSYHVVSYDANSGEVESKGTFQGYADSSAWSRGQGWGLYAYTMCYRFGKNPAYLDVAKRVASFVMTHHPAADDLIPYWDYDAPGIPNEPRDASAAAVIASGLIELSGYVDAELGKKYLDYAERILKQLSDSEYLAEVGENHGFVLKHSVGSFPHNSEVDVPLSYADYYYLEALVRYRDKLK